MGGMKKETLSWIGDSFIVQGLVLYYWSNGKTVCNLYRVCYLLVMSENVVWFRIVGFFVDNRI